MLSWIFNVGSLEKQSNDVHYDILSWPTSLYSSSVEKTKTVLHFVNLKSFRFFLIVTRLRYDIGNFVSVIMNMYSTFYDFVQLWEFLCVITYPWQRTFRGNTCLFGFMLWVFFYFIVVIDKPPVYALESETPFTTKCEFCQIKVTTYLEHKVGHCAWISCILIASFG